tara:strand:+ start:19 stop:255 length:237 start_codon:yes stop_codon:yes gene_type:complete
VCKRCPNIFINVKKRLVLGVLDIEKIRGNDNETGLKEGGGIEIIEISIYKCFPYTRLHSLSPFFAFCIYTYLYFPDKL